MCITRSEYVSPMDTMLWREEHFLHVPRPGSSPASKALSAPAMSPIQCVWRVGKVPFSSQFSTIQYTISQNIYKKPNTELVYFQCS